MYLFMAVFSSPWLEMSFSNSTPMSARIRLCTFVPERRRAGLHVARLPCRDAQHVMQHPFTLCHCHIGVRLHDVLRPLGSGSFTVNDFRTMRRTVIQRVERHRIIVRSGLVRARLPWYFACAANTDTGSPDRSWNVRLRSRVEMRQCVVWSDTSYSESHSLEKLVQPV